MNEARIDMDLNPTDFAGALELFKYATAELSRLWDHEDGDIFGDTYPKYLPDFDEFHCDVIEMEPQIPAPELPDLPPVGTIVRARYDIAPIPGGFVWKKGWTGEIAGDEPEYVHIQAYRYLGPDCHEWDNCRIISAEDGIFAYENEFSVDASSQPLEKLLAYALNQEFEVIS
jgi:hypothetical protein